MQQHNGFKFIGVCLFLLCWSFAVAGQNPSTEDEDFIDPTRPTVLESATTPKPGVLQLEYGITSNFGENSSSQRSSPLGIRFAPNKRLRLDFDLDVFTSQQDLGEPRMTGIGDTALGVKFIGRTEPKKHLAYAVLYSIKLPSASAEKELGTGRVDHNLRFILQRIIGKNDFGINVSYLNVGREVSHRRDSGAQVVLGYGHELPGGFEIINEIYGQTVDETAGGTRGIYTQSVLAYKINQRLRLDTGIRFGFGNDAPRYGVVGGITVGVADLFRHGK
ncbi:MAG: transporter [Pyrinomonadaceae bacterium]